MYQLRDSLRAETNALRAQRFKVQGSGFRISVIPVVAMTLIESM